MIIVYSVNQLMFVCKHGTKMSAHITAVHITIPKNIDGNINQSNKFTTLDVINCKHKNMMYRYRKVAIYPLSSDVSEFWIIRGNLGQT
jgi:hypothetical protein